MSSILIPKPALAEQLAIAAVLGKLQAAVEVQERIVARLKELKAATMAKLFREGLRGEPLKQTEIGEIPESWQVLALDKLLRLAQYGLSVRGERTGRYPILRMNCQEDGRVVFRDLQFVDVDDSTVAAFGLRNGDLLFNRTNSFELVGRTAIFHGKETAVFASYLIRLRVNEGLLLPDFVNYYLNLESVQAALKSLATRGVSQSNISASKLKGFKVCVPSKEEQSRIVLTLNRVSEALERAFERLNVLKGIFSSMLQLLMSGRVRVTSRMMALETVHARPSLAKGEGKAPDERTIEEIVRRIVEAVAPEKIILFGSAARGEMGPDSDVDLLVVKAGVHRGETAGLLYQVLADVGVSKDVVVATPEDIERHGETIGLVYRLALRDGKVIYAV